MGAIDEPLSSLKGGDDGLGAVGKPNNNSKWIISHMCCVCIKNKCNNNYHALDARHVVEVTDMSILEHLVYSNFVVSNT